MPHEPTTPDRRIVRTTTWFYEDLDRQLAAERGSGGEPSAHDFLVHELLRVDDVFRDAYESLPEHIDGRPELRVLVASGLLVRAFPVVGLFAADGAVELIAVELDLDWS